MVASVEPRVIPRPFVWIVCTTRARGFDRFFDAHGPFMSEEEATVYCAKVVGTLPNSWQTEAWVEKLSCRQPWLIGLTDDHFVSERWCHECDRDRDECVCCDECNCAECQCDDDSGDTCSPSDN